MDWFQRAKCKGNTELNFFPEAGHHAKEVLVFCSTCPVRRQCFEYAVDNMLDDGIWGGVSANRRVRYRWAKKRVS